METQNELEELSFNLKDHKAALKESNVESRCTAIQQKISELMVERAKAKAAAKAKAYAEEIETKREAAFRARTQGKSAQMLLEGHVFNSCFIDEADAGLKCNSLEEAYRKNPYSPCGEVVLTKPEPCQLGTETIESNNIKSEKENNMTKVVQLYLVDTDATMVAEGQSMVLKAGTYVTDNVDATIQEVIMEGKVAAAIDKHNVARSKVLNQTILQNTGQEVFLQAIRLRDLEWVVK